MPPSNLIFNMSGDDKYYEGERSKVGGREWGREFVTCLLEGEGLMFEKNLRVRHGS